MKSQTFSKIFCVYVCTCDVRSEISHLIKQSSIVTEGQCAIDQNVHLTPNIHHFMTVTLIIHTVYQEFITSLNFAKFVIFQMH